MLMPLRGDCGHLDTQGVALGYVLVGLSGRKPLRTAPTSGGVLAGRTIAGAVGNK